MTWWCGMSAAQMLPVAINHAVDVSITLSGPLSTGRRCRAGAAGQPTGAGTIFDGMLAPRVFAGRCMMTWMDEGMQLFGLDQSADHCKHVRYWAYIYRGISQAKRIQEGTGRGRAHARCTGMWTQVAAASQVSCLGQLHQRIIRLRSQTPPKHTQQISFEDPEIRKNLKDNPLTLETLIRKELEDRLPPLMTTQRQLRAWE